jgi:hypothetical protein
MSTGTKSAVVAAVTGVAVAAASVALFVKYMRSRQQQEGDDRASNLQATPDVPLPPVIARGPPSCPDGHPVVLNADVPGKSFPPIRNYGACDDCESRGTTYRCPVVGCDFDLCTGCFSIRGGDATTPVQTDTGASDSANNKNPPSLPPPPPTTTTPTTPTTAAAATHNNEGGEAACQKVNMSWGQAPHQLMTVVVVTSPVKSNPSTTMMVELMSYFALLPDLVSCL